MFSRDEMQRAIEDALKSMEGVALELYRRGREEAREELEEARERNADLRKMLEQVTRDRDHIEQAAVRLETQRDEARAEVERLRELKDYLRTWLSSEELEGLRVKAAEHPLLWEEIHHLKAEVERLREMAHDFEAMREDRDAAIARITEVGVMVATNGNALAKEAYRRGAEAMREAAFEAMLQMNVSAHRTECAEMVRALPIPEEP